MSDLIDKLRMQIKNAYTDLVEEHPQVAEIDPINDIISTINSGYMSVGKPEYCKPIDKSFVLTRGDLVERKIHSPPPFLGVCVFDLHSKFID